MEGHIYHSAEEGGRREREQSEGERASGGLSKAFCSTDEGISCLDLGGLSICAWGGVCMVGMRETWGTECRTSQGLL